MNYVNAEHIPGTKTLSDLFLERLIASSVDTVFGMPGGGANVFVEAPREKQTPIKYGPLRHEEVGALAGVG